MHVQRILTPFHLVYDACCSSWPVSLSPPRHLSDHEHSKQSRVDRSHKQRQAEITLIRFCDIFIFSLAANEQYLKRQNNARHCHVGWGLAPWQQACRAKSSRGFSDLHQIACSTSGRLSQQQYTMCWGEPAAAVTCIRAHVWPAH